MTTSSELVFRARSLDINNLPLIDAHIHTSWTDGEPTVAEAYARATEIGLTAILYSEHCRKTSTDWFGDFAREVRVLPDSPCKALIGAEVKVESVMGDIDLAKEIQELCDYVMASVHRFPDEKGNAIPFDEVASNEALEREYALTCAMLHNPAVDILGHMFGMSITRFKVLPDEARVKDVIKLAARRGVAVEINSRYHPDPFQLIQLCRELDALITFGSNAHRLAEIGPTIKMRGGNNAH